MLVLLAVVGLLFLVVALLSLSLSASVSAAVALAGLALLVLALLAVRLSERLRGHVYEWCEDLGIPGSVKHRYKHR